MNKSNDIFANLNDRQLEAVKYKSAPLLVLAGAGSGKTRVLTTRIVYMIQSGIAPEEILAVTFTNKAAKEMKARVARQVKAPVTIGTFHSICLGILRKNAAHIALAGDFTIYDDKDQLSIIKDCMKSLDIDEKMISPKQVRERISRSKDQLQSLREAAEDEANYDDGYFVPIYQKYEERLKSCNGVDFGDLIAKTVLLFSTVPEVLEAYHRQFRHILVDEYQDTNFAQYTFINQLAGKHRSITVVGDPDQSIYEWRGASAENMLKFEKDFKGAKVIRLEQNYRSTNTILKAANAVIARNSNRKPKNLWSEKGEGQLIELYRAQTDRMEAQNLIHKILMAKKEGYRSKDMVGFYRTHSQSRVFEEELRRNNIPYTIVGNVKFYARKEIKDLLAYLKIICNAGDEVNLLRIINTPKRSIGKTTVEKLRALGHHQGLSLYEAIGRYSQEPKTPQRLKNILSHFYQMIRIFRESSQILPLSGLLQTVIDTTGYVAALEQENTLESKIRIENIREFFASVKEFEESLRGDEPSNVFQAYLEFISLQTEIDTWHEEDEFFTLMTLHSAKGLEFPVVFMLGMEEGLLPHANAMNASFEELEEERRLCYVGFTRAMEKLYLSYAMSRRIFGYTKRQHPSRFLYEVPSKLLNRTVDDFSDYNDGDHLNDYGFEGEKVRYY
ncbi:MAG: UvrD-helicase domain-containing protein [Candidatus Omnitrophica bacterium]|nr:UvrD-helicase domain-containing protein [Candidatus Omnitrophota bacterium]